MFGEHVSLVNAKAHPMAWLCPWFLTLSLALQVQEDAGDIAPVVRWQRTRAVDDNRVGTARCHMCDCGHTRTTSGRLSKVSFKVT